MSYSDPHGGDAPSSSSDRSGLLLLSAMGGALLVLCCGVVLAGAVLGFGFSSPIGPQVRVNPQQPVMTVEVTQQVITPDRNDRTPLPGTATPRPTLTPVTTTARSIYELAIGDCFQDPSFAATDESGLVETVEVVDCDVPHDNELYATSVVAAEGDDPAFPGGAALDEQANRDCLAAFDPYVGVAYDDSFLAYFTLQPTEESWATGDRLILCALYDGTNLAPLRGSMYKIGE